MKKPAPSDAERVRGQQRLQKLLEEHQKADEAILAKPIRAPAIRADDAMVYRERADKVLALLRRYGLAPLGPSLEETVAASDEVVEAILRAQMKLREGGVLDKEERAFALILAMAETHVPGFKIAQRGGRPAVSHDDQRRVSYLVDAKVERNPNLSRGRARELVAKDLGLSEDQVRDRDEVYRRNGWFIDLMDRWRATGGKAES
jgi:hypothetical protein